MKVKELVNILQKHNPENEVYVFDLEAEQNFVINTVKSAEFSIAQTETIVQIQFEGDYGGEF
jgi:hypothetical protein